MAGRPHIRNSWIMIIAIVSIAGGFGTTALLDGAGMFPEPKGFTYSNTAIARQQTVPTVTVTPQATRTASASQPAPTTPVAESTATPVTTPGIVATSTPLLPVDIEYIVKSGDTLLDIALKYDTTIEAIVSLNGMTDKHSLSLGQKLKIPTATSSSPNPTPEGSSAKQSEQVYVVKPGDTLLEIAERFNTSVDAIMSRNNLDSPHTLKDGQQLTIPVGRRTP